eukprot:TRINITY_DN1382_c0_g1_i1.p2 TRINITY_DN1382_c0_g1~~TRINITY_DN1382_c0_g1_i1.p2  ORF type:complete len:177 (+),score=14.15 TRINITY_DN1382_c0_g1_i1:164-694(+)
MGGGRWGCTHTISQGKTGPTSGEGGSRGEQVTEWCVVRTRSCTHHAYAVSPAPPPPPPPYYKDTCVVVHAWCTTRMMHNTRGAQHARCTTRAVHRPLRKDPPTARSAGVREWLLLSAIRSADGSSLLSDLGMDGWMDGRMPFHLHHPMSDRLPFTTDRRRHTTHYTLPASADTYRR